MLSLEDDSQSKPAESQASAGHQQQAPQGNDSKLKKLPVLRVDNKSHCSRLEI